MSAPGRSAPGGGECLTPGGVLPWPGGWSSAPGGSAPRGVGMVSAPRGISQHALRQTPSPPVDRQTPVKIFTLGPTSLRDR